jgi:hypothetical protein
MDVTVPHLAGSGKTLRLFSHPHLHSFLRNYKRGKETSEVVSQFVDMDVTLPHLAGSDKTLILLSCQIWLDA